MAKVLLVDDSEIVRDTLARMLTRQGHQVIALSDGILGVEFMKTLGGDTIQLIISDVQMPLMNGIGFYRWLAQYKPHMLTHFIFCSSSEDMLNANEDVRNVPRLDKPATAEHFKAVVTAHIKGMDANSQLPQ